MSIFTLTAMASLNSSTKCDSQATLENEVHIKKELVRYNTTELNIELQARSLSDYLVNFVYRIYQ